MAQSSAVPGSSGVPQPGAREVVQPDALRPAYARAGVDVAAGERAVELMRARAMATYGSDVLAGIGGFAAAVRVPAGLREPVLVSATDGVGTKTALARAMRRYDTLGEDLVAMCADDVVCLGARPLVFLDYLAVGRVEPAAVAALVGGVARGCELAGCALVGGETAEHPGLLEPDEFDLAGFCVGIAEHDELLDPSAVEAGDALLGLAATGLHANGYSLVRSVLAAHDLPLERRYVEVVRHVLGPAEAARVAAEEPARTLATLGEVLLTPTRIYATDLLALRAHLAGLGLPLRSLAHVTGGGLPGNVPRALPAAFAARVEVGSWPVPSVIRLISALGELGGPEMRATLNGGLGMVAVVPEAAVAPARTFLASRGVAAWRIGRAVPAAEAGPARYLEVEAAG
jgi:phosphoribosylformylglycinamidine cyclo-ligase